MISSSSCQVLFFDEYFSHFGDQMIFVSFLYHGAGVQTIFQKRYLVPSTSNVFMGKKCIIERHTDGSSLPVEKVKDLAREILSLHEEPCFSSTFHFRQHPTGTRHTRRHRPQTAPLCFPGRPDSAGCSLPRWPRSRQPRDRHPNGSCPRH